MVNERRRKSNSMSIVFDIKKLATFSNEELSISIVADGEKIIEDEGNNLNLAND